MRKYSKLFIINSALLSAITKDMLFRYRELWGMQLYYLLIVGIEYKSYIRKFTRALRGEKHLHSSELNVICNTLQGM